MLFKLPNELIFMILDQVDKLSEWDTQDIYNLRQCSKEAKEYIDSWQEINVTRWFHTMDRERRFYLLSKYI